MGSVCVCENVIVNESNGHQKKTILGQRFEDRENASQKRFLPNESSKYLGSIQVTTHMDPINHCKTASGKNSSKMDLMSIDRKCLPRRGS